MIKSKKKKAISKADLEMEFRDLVRGDVISIKTDVRISWQNDVTPSADFNDHEFANSDYAEDFLSVHPTVRQANKQYAKNIQVWIKKATKMAKILGEDPDEFIDQIVNDNTD